MIRSMFVSITLAILISTTSLFAQHPGFDGDRPMGPKFQQFQKGNALDLTDEQKTQIDKLRLEHQKEVTLLREELQTLNSEYRLMVIDPKASDSQLKAQLTKISAKRELMAFKKAQHQRKVRTLLTDDQKVKFDQHLLNGSKKAGRHGQRGAKGRRSMRQKMH